MRNETSLRAVVAVLAVVAAGAWLFAASETADAGHTFGDGYCFALPRTCVSGYIALGDQEHFRVENIRPGEPWWNANFETALRRSEYVWTLSVGPQLPAEVIDPEPSWVNDLSYDNRYLECDTAISQDPLDRCNGTTSPFDYIAYVCLGDATHTLHCNSAERVYAERSRTFVNIDFVNLHTSTQKENIFAHEFGHTMLLGHHAEQTNCLMYPQVTAYLSPQLCDLGETVPCDSYPDGDTYGIRCIFQWWRELQQPGPPPQPIYDCHDLNRDGKVDLPNDILGTILAYTGNTGENRAPSQFYQPETDTDRDGKVDLPNDILGTILDYGGNDADHCDDEHYPHA